MTTPTGKPRGRPKGSPKTGGRVAKSLDRGERLVVNAQMAGDILAVYARLGGEDFLFKWAKENPSLYVTNVLSKLMPAAPKDGEADTYNTQINVNGLSELEAARRVAYALAKAAYTLQDEEPAPAIEADITPRGGAYQSPQAAVNEWTPPADVPAEPMDDRRREQWASEPTDPVRNSSLETLGGSAAEQGRTVSRPTAQPKRSAAELCRSLSRRGRDLM